MRVLIPGVFAYSDQYQHRVTIDMDELNRLPNQLAIVNNYIIGVSIHGGVYRLWNSRGDQVIVHILSGRNVLMTPELHARYDRYFTPSRPSWDGLHRRLGAR